MTILLVMLLTIVVCAVVIIMNKAVVLKFSITFDWVQIVLMQVMQIVMFGWVEIIHRLIWKIRSTTKMTNLFLCFLEKETQKGNPTWWV